MRSFKDFLLEKSISVSSRLLKENVEKDLYWLNVDFINYLYFIENGEFNPKLTKGRQLVFVSEQSSSKSDFNNIFDYPVTLYFDKETFKYFIDKKEDKGELKEALDPGEEVGEPEEEPTEVPEEPLEAPEDTVEDPEEELPPEYSMSPDKFDFDISRNKDLLVKIELNYTPINELTLEKDFRDFTKIFTIKFSNDTDNLKTKFKERITAKTEQWLIKSKTKVELIITD